MCQNLLPLCGCADVSRYRTDYIELEKKASKSVIGGVVVCCDVLAIWNKTDICKHEQMNWFMGVPFQVFPCAFIRRKCTEKTEIQVYFSLHDRVYVLVFLRF